MIEELEGKPYSPGQGIRAMLGIENTKSIRHLPQRMHDYEKYYSPALKKLRGIGYAMPENARAAAQMKGYRPGGKAYDNRNTCLPPLARQTTFQPIDMMIMRKKSN
jgi:hypothetical protein